jgi:hypothetical protein
MANNLLILGLIAGAFFLSKSNVAKSTTGDGTPPPMVTITPDNKFDYGNQPLDHQNEIPTAQPVRVGNNYYHGDNSNYLASRVNVIQGEIANNPSDVVYYPTVGVVTTGGLGYSTAFPSSYLQENTTYSVTNRSNSSGTVFQSTAHPISTTTTHPVTPTRVTPQATPSVSVSAPVPQVFINPWKK